MHELGVLCSVVQTVEKVAQENKIKKIKHLTIEVGKESGFVPVFLEKLFPVATDNRPLFAKARLNIETVEGKGLVIKELGY